MTGRRRRDSTLLVTLVAAIALIVISGYLHPSFRRPEVPPVAEWHVINVNAGGYLGDANLLLVGDQVIMIDAGLQPAGYVSVVPYLYEIGALTIDHFFISNPDPAFFEGLGSVMEKGITVENLYYQPVVGEIGVEAMQPAVDEAVDGKPGDEVPQEVMDALAYFDAYLDHARAEGVEMHPVTDGFILPLPNSTRIRVIAAGASEPETVTYHPGDASLVMRFELPRSSVLFSGNPGMNFGEALASRGDLRSMFLKAPLPGGDTPPGAFYDAVDPEFLLVPSAKRYWCGEDGAVARQWSIEHETPTWVTGINGHIRVIWNKRQVMVLPRGMNEMCKLREFGNYIR